MQSFDEQCQVSEYFPSAYAISHCGGSAPLFQLKLFAAQGLELLPGTPI